MQMGDDDDAFDYRRSSRCLDRERRGPQRRMVRTGLDHLAFGVATRAELEEWEKQLSSRGITFTPIAETPIGSVIVFRDPDNIQLEFWLPAS